MENLRSKSTVLLPLGSKTKKYMISKFCIGRMEEVSSKKKIPNSNENYELPKISFVHTKSKKVRKIKKEIVIKERPSQPFPSLSQTFAKINSVNNSSPLWFLQKFTFEL